MELGFILTEAAKYPDAAAIVTAAGKLGAALTLSSFEDEGPMSFDLPDGSTVMYMLIAAAHPDAMTMIGPLSPSPDEVARARAHYIVTVLGADGVSDSADANDVAKTDLRTAALITALVDALPDAVGAMLGHGVVFQKARLFSELTALGVSEGLLPVEVAVDLTAAPEPDDRVSFLTHGMTRHGREELMVTCPVRGRGALDFMLSMVRWLYLDPDKHLPTGDTVGRTAEEKIVVQRVANPTGRGPEVIRLDLMS